MMNHNEHFNAAEITRVVAPPLACLAALNNAHLSMHCVLSKLKESDPSLVSVST